MKRSNIVLSLLSLLTILITALVYIIARPTSYIEDYEDIVGFNESYNENSKSLRVTYLGVSTLLFDDGETSFMTDAFFSRPSLFKAGFTKLSPDEEVVNYALGKINTSRLKAIIPVHSHYDHTLDSSMVVSKTGAILMGSESTANIGRSFGLKESQIKVVDLAEKVTIGKFSITFIASEHSPNALYSGAINNIIELPARAEDFKLGECYSLLIEHDGKRILVHGSANFIPDMYKNIKADLVFLGTGVLGVQSQEFRSNYWNEVIKETSAKRAILIHWDDFWLPLASPQRPQPWPIDDFNLAMSFLLKQGKEDGVDVRIPKLWQEFSPFEQD